MVMSILKTTEIDLIWFMIYLGMFVGVISIFLVIYGTYLDIKNKDK
jgi:hypothetical protein